MTLILRTISYKGLPPSQEISGLFDTQGGTIGRAPNNHLVLPDPEKFISRLHATIVFEAGQYFIQDSSTGGTYLNDSDMPLQQARAPLHDGEKLRIGEYELRVSITDSAASVGHNIETPVRQLDLAESHILDDPFAPAKPTAPAADFFSSFVEQAESAPVHESFIPPDVASTPTAPPVDDLDFSDLLSKLDELPGIGGSKGQAPELPPLPDDFFAEESEQPAEVEPVTKETGVFELDSADKGEAAAAPPPEETFASTDPFAIAGQPVHEEPAPTHEFHGEPVAKASEATTPEPVSVQAVISPQIAPVTTPPSTADDSLMREFLAGAGITDPHFIAPEQWPTLMRTSGELLRSMVEGLMQVLRARAELKSQFRVSVTTMRSVDNNPLKFTPNVDDAMRLMLSPTNPGFLPPKQAVSEGFSGIMSHQIAMTAGIQAALADVLRSFDPQLIEKAQGEGVLFQKKTKCWDYYVDKYPQLKAVAQEEFFGDAFADAYEKQMLLLSRAAPKT